MVVVCAWCGLLEVAFDLLKRETCCLKSLTFFFPGKKIQGQKKRPPLVESNELHSERFLKKHANHIDAFILGCTDKWICWSASWLANKDAPPRELTDMSRLIFAPLKTPDLCALLFAMPKTGQCWAFYIECDKLFVDAAANVFQNMIGVEAHAVCRFHPVLDPPCTSKLYIVSIISFVINHWNGQPPDKWNVEKYVAPMFMSFFCNCKDNSQKMMDSCLRPLFNKQKVIENVPNVHQNDVEANVDKVVDLTERMVDQESVSLQSILGSQLPNPLIVAETSIERKTSNEAQGEQEAILEMSVDRNDAEARACPVLNFENGRERADEFIGLESIKQMFQLESVHLQKLLGPGTGDEELRLQVLAIARPCLDDFDLDDRDAIIKYWNETSMSRLDLQTDPTESILPGIVRRIIEQHGRRGLVYIFSPFPDLFQLDEGLKSDLQYVWNFVPQPLRVPNGDDDLGLKNMIISDDEEEQLQAIVEENFAFVCAKTFPGSLLDHLSSQGEAPRDLPTNEPIILSGIERDAGEMQNKRKTKKAKSDELEFPNFESRNSAEQTAVRLLRQVLSTLSPEHRQDLRDILERLDMTFLPLEKVIPALIDIIFSVETIEIRLANVLALENMADENKARNWKAKADFEFYNDNGCIILSPNWQEHVVPCAENIGEIENLRLLLQSHCFLAPFQMQNHEWCVIVRQMVVGQVCWSIYGNRVDCASAIECLCHMLLLPRPHASIELQPAFVPTCSEEVVAAILHTAVLLPKENKPDPTAWQIIRFGVGLADWPKFLSNLMERNLPSLALAPNLRHVSQRPQRVLPLPESWLNAVVAEINALVEAVSLSSLGSDCFIQPLGLVVVVNAEHAEGRVFLSQTCADSLRLSIPFESISKCPSLNGCSGFHRMEDTQLVFDISSDSIDWMICYEKEQKVYPCGGMHSLEIDDFILIELRKAKKAQCILIGEGELLDVTDSREGIFVGESLVCETNLRPFAVSVCGKFAVVQAGNKKVVLEKKLFSNKHQLSNRLDEALDCVFLGTVKHLSSLRRYFFRTQKRVQVVSRIGFVDDVFVLSSDYQVVYSNGKYEVKTQDDTGIYIDDQSKAVLEQRGKGMQKYALEHPSKRLSQAKWQPTRLSWTEAEALTEFRNVHECVKRCWNDRNYAQFFSSIAHLGFGMPQYTESFVPGMVASGISKSGKTVVEKAKIVCGGMPLVGKTLGKGGSEYFFIDDASTTLDDVKQRMKWGSIIVLDDYDAENRKSLYRTMQSVTRGGKILLSEIHNPENENKNSAPQSERTLLHCVNWKPLENNSAHKAAFEVEFFKLLQQLHIIAPVLRKHLDLESEAARLSDDEWKEFNEHLERNGVIDHAVMGSPSYKVVEISMYREWLRFALCEAELLGPVLAADENARRKCVFEMFRDVLGMKSLTEHFSAVAAVAHVDENTISDFESVVERDVRCRISHTKVVDRKLFVVTTLKGKKCWVWSNLRNIGNGLPRAKLKDILTTKSTIPFEQIEVVAESVGVKKLFDAGARRKTGSEKAILIPIDDPDLKQYIFLKIEKK